MESRVESDSQKTFAAIIETSRLETEDQRRDLSSKHNTLCYYIRISFLLLTEKIKFWLSLAELSLLSDVGSLRQSLSVPEWTQTEDRAIT